MIYMLIMWTILQWLMLQKKNLMTRKSINILLEYLQLVLHQRLGRYRKTYFTEI